MAFTWSILNKGTTVTKNQISEVKDNINSVRATIGLTPWTWTTIPVTVGTLIKNPSIDELRNALDVTDDENICSVENITENIGYFASDEVIHNASEYGSNSCGGYCVINWIGNYTTILNSDTGCPGHYSVYQGSWLHYR